MNQLADPYAKFCLENKLVHSLHTSESKSWRGCRRRHDWIFKDRFYPIITPKPLEFGVAFHSGMEAYYDPMNWHDHETAQALALVAFTEKTREQLENYMRLTNRDSVDELEDEVRQDYAERVDLGRRMLQYYTTKVAPILDEGLTPLKVEIKFEVPIVDPSGDFLYCKCQICWDKACVFWSNEPESIRRDKATWKGLLVTYGGRIDCLMEDSLGNLYIVDWKTAARLSAGDEDTDGYLLVEDQITRYCWALRVLGLDIRGFIYHEQKKAVPEEPTMNKNQRLGRWFSVSKSQDTDVDTYRRTVMENDTAAYEAGLYNEFLSWLAVEGGKFYARKKIERNEHELRHAGGNIWREAMDILHSSYIYPNAGRFTCQTCAFLQPCLGKNRGDDYMYTLNSMYEKRVRHYYEEAEPSTDKGGMNV